MALVLSVLEQGMIYAIMALGVYITYKILDFPDLTVDGSFPLGAAITAVMITKGVHPLITLVVSFAAGAVVGVLTGVIHVKLKVRDLLSGIIMMTALYTVNLRIAGRANLPIYTEKTIFDNDLVNSIFKGNAAQFSTVVIILIITLVMKYLLDWYMSTKAGFLLRAVGDNDTIVTSMGVDKGLIKIAVTHYRVLQTLKGASFMEFELETGRTHQIRVHMASISHPLLGDTVYGNSKNPYKLQGQALHARTIGFIHPTTGEYIEVSAPIPEYMTELVRKLS